MVSRARHWVLVPTQQSDVIDRQNVSGLVNVMYR